MKTSIPLLLTLLTTPLVHADALQAEQLVRAGNPAEALEVLGSDESVEAAFWKGRALIDLGRLKDAANVLRNVPDEHELYPYAAKALLYCAWKNKDVDFAVIATPMATGANEEIATLATAALAEYWLSKPNSQDNSALARFRELAQNKSEFKNLLSLLEIENLRQRGEYDKAIAQCRAIEADTTLPVIIHHRARLALSSIYYDKEATQPSDSSATPDANFHIAEAQEDEATAPDQPEYDDGKGEETLLHFISSHPESPLLEEAFRRLYQKNAFTTSEYAQTKLKEWANDPLKSHRAANALLIQQHLQNQEQAKDLPLDVTAANTAAATCPKEPATRTILLEQTRWFLERGQMHEALLYMGMIPGNDATRQFYEAQLRDSAQTSTARAYLECARNAPDTLRSAALENALICALLSDDTETQDAVLNMKDISGAQHYSLLRIRAAYWLDKDADKAHSDINKLLNMQAPDNNLRADVEMDQAYLHLQLNPETSRELLLRSFINTHLTELTPERQLRFFALQEAALCRIAGAEKKHDAEMACIDLIRNAAGKVHSPQVVAILTLHLAHLQSEVSLYEEALKTLNLLLRKYPRTDFAPRAIFMSASVSEMIGSMEALERAVALYEECAQKSEELRIRALTRKAAVLLRLGKHEQSEQLLNHMLRIYPDMRKQDRIMANAILANNKALLGTDEGRKEAIRIAGIALEDSSLPRWWKFRTLLHHATLCERSGMYQEALKDYETILSLAPASEKAPEKADWHILYSAGAGAVLQLLHLERYTEAAEKADEIANWNKEAAAYSKRKEFSDWAIFIRQTNFVDNNNLPF